MIGGGHAQGGRENRFRRPADSRPRAHFAAAVGHPAGQLQVLILLRRPDVSAPCKGEKPGDPPSSCRVPDLSRLLRRLALRRRRTFTATPFRAGISSPPPVSVLG